MDTLKIPHGHQQAKSFMGIKLLIDLVTLAPGTLTFLVIVVINVQYSAA